MIEKDPKIEKERIINFDKNVPIEGPIEGLIEIENKELLKSYLKKLEERLSILENKKTQKSSLKNDVMKSLGLTPDIATSNALSFSVLEQFQKDYFIFENNSEKNSEEIFKGYENENEFINRTFDV